MQETIVHIIALLSMAVLAIQIAYDSVLAQRVKKIVFLNNNALESLILPLKRKHHFIVFFLLPIIILIYIYVKVNLYIKELCDCAYCTSFWLGIMAGLLLQQPILITLLYAPLTIGFVYLYEKLING